jgi:hypothetical protein
MNKAVEMDAIVDYAMPLMRIDALAKQIHDSCLHGDLAHAEELTVHLVAEGRVLRNSLMIMQNKDAR